MNRTLVRPAERLAAKKKKKKKKAPLTGMVNFRFEASAQVAAEQSFTLIRGRKLVVTLPKESASGSSSRGGDGGDGGGATRAEQKEGASSVASAGTATLPSSVAVAVAAAWHGRL